MMTTHKIPPLIALVYRESHRCRQYAFCSTDDLAAWTARPPYKNERIRVLPVKDGKFVGDQLLPSADAVKFVQGAIGAQA